MNQTRMESFVEALVNIAIGFGVNFVANLVILPYYGFTSLDTATNLKIGIAFTLVSIVRSYFIRRFFNAQLHKLIHQVFA